MNKEKKQEDKKAFRETRLQKLFSLEKQELEIASKKASNILFSHSLFVKAQEILIYLPFVKSELDLVDSLLKSPEKLKNKNFYSPKVLNQGGKISCAFEKLEPERKSFRTIPPDCFDFLRLELILIPGLSFDRRGVRLGRGLGYYDRLISKLRSLEIKKKVTKKAALIGVCPEKVLSSQFDFQEEHDQRVDFILSETSISPAEN